MTAPTSEVASGSALAQGLSGQRDHLFSLVQKHGAVAVLLVLVVTASLYFERFLTVRNVENILLQSSFLGLIVVGMTLVIISGGIDLSVGSQLALGGVVAAMSLPLGVVAAIVLPILACGTIGAIQGLLIAKGKLAPFIVTLGGLVGVRGLALALAGERTIGIREEPAFTFLGRGEVLGVPFPVLLVLAAFLIGGVVLTRTRFGTAIYAIGDNEEAARLMGTKVERTKFIAYTVNGALAGFAGMLLAARLSAGQPVAGAAWELDAIAAVVVGGTLLTGGDGSMSGAFVGVLLLHVLQNLVNQVGTLTSYTQQMISGVFLVVVVAAQTYLSRKRISQ